MVLFTASYYFKQMLGKIISCHKRDHCLFKTLPQIKYYAHRNLFESIVCFYEKLFMMHNYFLIEYGSKMFTFLIFMFIKNGCPLYRTFCDEESQCLSPICCCSVTQSCLTLLSHGLRHARLPGPSPSPGACSNSCPLSQ